MKNNATLKNNTSVVSSTSGKTKTKKNGLAYLLRQRFTTLQFHTGRIITFSVFMAIFIVVNVISMIWLNGGDQPWLSGVFIIAASCVAGILMMVMAISIFRGEAKSNQINLELREGYKPRQIYIARIVEMAFIIAVFMIIALIVNLITIGAKGQMDNVLWYHMYVTSLGWYAIVCIIAAGMAIFFCGFLNSGWSGTVTTFIMLLVIVIGGVIPGAAAMGGNPKAGSQDYAGEITSKKIDNSIINFVENDLGIASLDDAEKVMNVFTSALTNDIKSNKTGIDWVTYGEMTLGKFPHDDEPDNNNFDETDPTQYLNNPSVFGALAAFGNSIAKEENEALPTKLVDFFDDTKDFFKSHDTDFKFNDITNWDILDGKSTGKVMTNWTIGNGVHPYAKRDGSTTSSENFLKIMNDISKDSKFANKYSFVKELKDYSNATALSTMFNEHGSYPNANGGSYDYGNNEVKYGYQETDGTDNIDWSQRLYPTFGLGGYRTSKNNVQSQIENFAKENKITPAEFLFNRNIMFWVEKAFTDLNAHASWKAGRTVLAPNAEYYYKDNEVVLHVNNAYEFRYNGVTYGMSDLKEGLLPKEALAGLVVKIGDQTYHANDMIDAQYVRSYTHGRFYNNSGKGNGNTPDGEYPESVSDYNKITDQNVIAFSVKKAPFSQEGKRYGSGYGVRGMIKYSMNPMFMISGSEGDLGNYDPDDHNMNDQPTPNFDGLNKWLSDEKNKTIISNIKFDNKKTITFRLWNSDAKEAMDKLANIKFSDGNSPIDKSQITWDDQNDDKGSTVTATFSNEVSKLKLSFDNDAAKSAINTNLIDGSFFMPTFDYKDSETHKSAISWIYNPLTQLQAMFNGVNYRNEAMDNLMTSFINENYVGINSLNVRITLAPDAHNPFSNTMNVERNSYVEIVYIYYVFIESLFVFVGFWMYRKSIVS